MTWKLAVGVVPPIQESERAGSLYVEMRFKFDGNKVLTKEWRERQLHVGDARIKSLEGKGASLLGLILCVVGRRANRERTILES